MNGSKGHTCLRTIFESLTYMALSEGEMRLLLVLHFRERDSVLDCVRQAWARRRFGRPDSRLRPKNMQHLAKAVSAMQACAMHLCHRTPRRCRVTRVPQNSRQHP